MNWQLAFPKVLIKKVKISLQRGPVADSYEVSAEIMHRRLDELEEELDTRALHLTQGLRGGIFVENFTAVSGIARESDLRCLTKVSVFCSSRNLNKGKDLQDKKHRWGCFLKKDPTRPPTH